MVARGLAGGHSRHGGAPGRPIIHADTSFVAVNREHRDEESQQDAQMVHREMLREHQAHHCV